MKPLKKWVVSYRIGAGPRMDQIVYVATRGAAIEAVTEPDDHGNPICARSDIIAVYGVPR